MKIVWSRDPVIVDGELFRPMCRYVVSEWTCEDLVRRSSPGCWSWSSFNAYERRYAGQTLKAGQSVCVYRHNAFGDQLMISAVPFEIKRRNPDAVVHMYCHKDVANLWLANPYIGGTALELPIPFDAAQRYDYHLFYEGMLENNSERDQNCCYDDFFSYAGLTDVPDDSKRPQINVRPEDYRFFNEAALPAGYILYHLNPNNPNRCYPFELSKVTITKLLGLRPVVVVGVTKENYKPFIPASAIDLVNKTPKFRDLLPIVERAAVVVAPDSSVMHIAGGFSKACVSLWGLFDPNDRVKYYKNHVALTAFDACPHAPCRDHNFVLPEDKCRDADMAFREGCAALSSISPDRIVEAVRQML